MYLSTCGEFMMINAPYSFCSQISPIDLLEEKRRWYQKPKTRFFFFSALFTPFRVCSFVCVFFFVTQVRVERVRGMLELARLARMYVHSYQFQEKLSRFSIIHVGIVFVHKYSATSNLSVLLFFFSLSD